nr:immunoglobulin heavy chain junction region [Mus musculus]MBK4189836.1 immunoglobulin heavy chain junction region [Mus musculus]
CARADGYYGYFDVW